MKQRPLTGWILGALLLALASVSAAEPVKGKHAKKHVTATAPAPPLVLPPISKRYSYMTPFQMESAAYQAKTTAATPGDLQNQQPDSAGVPHLALHPQTPLVTVGDWDFAADAHLPLTHARDVGAAISAKHDF